MTIAINHPFKELCSKGPLASLETLQDNFIVKSPRSIVKISILMLMKDAFYSL